MGCCSSNKKEPKTENKYNDNKDNIELLIKDDEKDNIGTLAGYYYYSKWLPLEFSKIQEYVAIVIKQARENMDNNVELANPIQCLQKAVKSNNILNGKVAAMCKQNIAQMAQADAQPVKDPQRLYITNPQDLYHGLHVIISSPPTFIGNHLIGVPIAAFLTTVDATLAGQEVFRIPEWNSALQHVLSCWGKYLSSDKSNGGFTKMGEGWLSRKALKDWNNSATNQNDSEWKYDEESIPWYNSWNSFFARTFKDPDKSRPTAHKDDNTIIASCNEGHLFRWRENIAESNPYWLLHHVPQKSILLKDMPYSLEDIFTTSIQNDQEILNKFKLKERFTNGYVFQTFLDPFNYHRWCTCVTGTYLFKPITVPGCYYSKLVVPDYQGSTTDSCPYLLEVNARGIVVIDTTGYANIGFVCMVPIGMVEVSSIQFAKIPKNNDGKYFVNKGEEIGHFQFGGSSFAIIFEDVAKYKKTIKFRPNKSSELFQKNPTLPNPDGTTGIKVLFRQEIADIANIV